MGTKNMRVKERTINAVNKIAGKIQRETGANKTADDAVWAMIKKLYPKIAQEAIEEFGFGNGENPADQ